MPGRFFLERSIADIQSEIPLPECDLSVAPRKNIAPGQNVLVGTSANYEMMRWGIIPVGRKNARGRPVMETIVNARSETVFDKSAFEGAERCIVPADGWYEWTGEQRKKTAWRIKPKDGRLLYFAGIFDVWKGPNGISVPQVATLTCAPNKDVQDIHHRMAVIFSAENAKVWLGPNSKKAAELMRPLKEGFLTIEKVTDVDWQAS